MVYYFYLVFNCPHVEAYCKLVSSNNIAGLPIELNPTNIRKFYSHNDPIRAKAQLSKKPILKHPIREYTLTYCGELVELDVLMVHSPSSNIPRAHGGFRHVVLVVDVFSSYLSCVPIKSMTKPQRFIESVVQNYQTHGHPIKHLKMDNQFNTTAVIAYLEAMNITYQFAPPYEHEFIGSIERHNRTAQDKLSCALSISSAKNKKLWLYALTDAIAKLNNVPRRHLAWTSPYTKWFNKEYDFTKKPLLLDAKLWPTIPLTLNPKSVIMLHYIIMSRLKEFYYIIQKLN
jgi:hypothetical protein